MRNRKLDQMEFTYSPPLNYEFYQPSKPYLLSSYISPGAELITKIAKYLGEYRTEPLGEIYDSLEVLSWLLQWPTYMKVSNLYDLDWQNLNAKYLDSFGRIRKIQTMDDLKKDEYHNEVHKGEPIRVDAYMFSPIKIYDLEVDKILSHPNICEILEWLDQKQEPKAMSIQAALYLAMDQEDRAIEIYQNMGETNSLGAYDYYNFGTIYLLRYYKSAEDQKDQGNIQMARKLYERASDLDITRYNLGLVYLYENDYQKARGQFEQLAEEYDFENTDLSMSGQFIFLNRIKKRSCYSLSITLLLCSKDIRESEYWFDQSQLRKDIAEPSYISYISYLSFAYFIAQKIKLS